ncbi:hypothetical protein FGW37_16370 [Streptomyces rectiverticillatus]|uniref:hypothetical protein n=1 Tax=Streptomyces rectiverticillatus TaxID=173860 RepID=UPI0015C38A58|nr:hypothetical protein [Streptomyces rectiverticillatus]QLE72959.1 hypothetical protein FGW37_16370 [Streptomyces rectiverticillatus]
MTGNQTSVLSEWILPAAVCAPVTWVCLVHRFRGQGRLLGTVRSVSSALAVVLWTSAMAALASGLLLPHASSVPPAAVGVVAGAGLVPKKRTEQAEHPVMAIVTLGHSLLINSLMLRLQTDRAEWCARMTGGFDNCWELDVFADRVARHLRSRVDVPGRSPKGRSGLVTSIKDRYEEVRAAVQQADTLETEIEKVCKDEQRERTPQEAGRMLRAFGEAEHLCACLLELAHAHGKRSDDKKILALRRQPLYAAAAEVPAR